MQKRSGKEWGRGVTGRPPRPAPTTRQITEGEPHVTAAVDKTQAAAAAAHQLAPAACDAAGAVK